MKPTEMNAYLSTLAASVVFRGLEASALEQLMRQGLLLEAKQGDLISYEHMPGGIGLYVVLEGRVEVFRSRGANPESEAGDDIHLNTLKPGHCFGEYSLMDGQSTSASAKALVSTRLFFLPRGAFLQFADSNPQVGKAVYLNLLLFLIKRLRQKDEELNARR